MIFAETGIVIGVSTYKYKHLRQGLMLTNAPARQNLDRLIFRTGGA
jgi:hypothetical protein